MLSAVGHHGRVTSRPDKGNREHSMKTMFRRGAVRWIAAGVLAVTALAAGGLGYQAWAQARTRITVYTAIENEQLTPVKQAIEAAVPGVEIASVRDSTDGTTAHLLAELASPR